MEAMAGTSLNDGMTEPLDQLSKVFDLVAVRGLVSGGFAVRGRWESHSPLHDPLKLIALVAGGARLMTDGMDEPIDLRAGDVAILSNRSWIRLEGGAGDGPPRRVVPEADDPSLYLSAADLAADDIVIGGRIDLNAAGQALLQQALPPVGHVQASGATATHLRASLDRLFVELRTPRIGSGFAIRQHGQLLVLEVLRAFVEQAELPPGWLRLLIDEPLRPAVALMHAEPGRAWRLEELARAAAMSRTSFAERFRLVADVPPLTYLHQWRMLLARRALREDDVRIGSLAFELGYGSESAFSTAFKREVGEAPLHYRRRFRVGSAAPLQAVSG